MTKKEREIITQELYALDSLKVSDVDELYNMAEQNQNGRGLYETMINAYKLGHVRGERKNAQARYYVANMLAYADELNTTLTEDPADTSTAKNYAEQIADNVNRLAKVLGVELKK